MVDDFLPCFDVGRRAGIWLPAAPANVYAALKSVTVGEVRLFAPLMWLRCVPERLFGVARPLDRTAPILEAFLQAGFVVLGERPGHEYLIGGIGRFWSPIHHWPVDSLRTPAAFLDFAEPGFTKAAFHFVVRPERAGTWLESEIRMHGTSRGASAWFRCYWLTIGWFSGLIRLSGLQAIRRRLERDAAP